MTDTKAFRIESVLGLVTGIGFERGLDGMKQLIEFMTGEPASELTFLDNSPTGRIALCKGKLMNDIHELDDFLTAFTWDTASKCETVLRLARDKFGDSVEVKRFDPYPQPPTKQLA